MADFVETMAFSGETPWHGLGTEVSDTITTDAMLKASGLDWKVSKEVLYLGDNTEVPKMRAIVRDTDKKVLSIVGSTYKVTQNSEVFDFFRKFIEAGDMTLETAGSLHGGQYVWCLARVKKDFSIGKDDEMRSYLLLCNPHIYGYSRTVKFTSVRVVCWNTLNFALGAALNGKRTPGRSFSIPHSIEFNDVAKAAAERALGIAMEQAAEYEEAVKVFAKTKMKSDAVLDYFQEVLKYDPRAAKVRKDGTPRIPSMLSKFNEALEAAPGHDLKSSKGTLWGALNAVTYVIDHEMGRSRDNGLTGAWFGYTGDIKKRAFVLALEKTKK